MKKIRATLSTLDNLVKELEQHKRSLAAKEERLKQRIAEEIAAEAEVGFNGAIYDDVLHEGMKVPDVQIKVENSGRYTVVIAEGTEAVFAEFGAGVYYNPDGGPARPQGIVAIGEYGKGYGKRQIWGYYDENGDLKLTHGTPASRPMFNAIQNVLPRIPQIAKEVFS